MKAKTPSHHSNDKLKAEQKSNGTKVLNLVGSDLANLEALWIQPSIVENRGIYRTLYLSNNSLHSLQGINAFHNLAVLSLCNNQLSYYDQIEPLSELKNLEKLSLTGNRVTLNAYYREVVITSICTRLMSFDGMKVSDIDRIEAKAIYHKAKAVYEQLRITEFRNCVLKHLSGISNCHAEMQSCIFGKYRSVLGPHIGYSKSSQQSLQSNSYCGKVLLLAMSGGVYRWLQMMASEYFSRITQMNLQRIGTKVARKQASHGGGLMGDMDSKSSAGGLWDKVVSIYMQTQQTRFLELVGGCEIVHDDWNIQSNDITGPQIDVLNAINQLNFTSISMQATIGRGTTADPHTKQQKRRLLQDHTSQDHTNYYDQADFCGVSRHCRNSALPEPHFHSNERESRRVDQNTDIDNRGRVAGGYTSMHNKFQSNPPGKKSVHFKIETQDRRRQLDPDSDRPVDYSPGDLDSIAGKYVALLNARVLDNTRTKTQVDRNNDVSQSEFLKKQMQAVDESLSAYKRDTLHQPCVGSGNGTVDEDADTDPVMDTARLYTRASMVRVSTEQLPPQQVEPDDADLTPMIPNIGHDNKTIYEMEAEERAGGSMDSSQGHLFRLASVPTPATSSITSIESSSPTAPEINVEGKEIEDFIRSASSAACLAACGSDNYQIEDLDISDPFLKALQSNELWNEAVKNIMDFTRAGSAARQAIAESKERRRQLLDPEAIAKANSKDVTMGELKVFVTDLNNEFLMRRREEFDLWEGNQSLADSCAALERRSSEVARGSFIVLRTLGSYVTSVEEENKQAGQWVLSASETLQEIKDTRLLVESTKVYIKKGYEHVDTIRESTSKEFSKREHLEASFVEVERAISSIYADLGDQQHDNAVLVRQQQCKERAELYYLKYGIYSSNFRHIFKKFRHNTRLSRRIRDLAHMCLTNRGRRQQQQCFQMWCDLVGTAKIAKKVRRTNSRCTLRNSFAIWMCRLQQTRAAHCVSQRANISALTRCWNSWRVQQGTHQVIRMKESRQEIYVHIFCLIRLFRAWKRLTKEGRKSRSRLVEQLRTNHARWTISRWHAAAGRVAQRRVSLETQAKELVRTSRLKDLFQCWHTLHQFRQHLHQSTSKRRCLRTWQKRCAVYRHHRITFWNLSPIPHHRIRRVFDRLIHLCHRRWRCRRAASSVRKLRTRFDSSLQTLYKRPLSYFWSLWRELLSNYQELKASLSPSRGNPITTDRAVGEMALLDLPRSTAGEDLRHEQYDISGSAQQSRSSRATNRALHSTEGKEAAEVEMESYLRARKATLSVVTKQAAQYLLCSDSDSDSGSESDEEVRSAGSDSSADAGRGTSFSVKRPAIVMRRYLRCWSQFSTRRRLLTGLHARVQHSEARHSLRRHFSDLTSLWGKAIAGHLRTLLHSRNNVEVLKRVDEGKSESARKRSILNEEIAEAVDQHLELELNVAQVQISLDEAAQKLAVMDGTIEERRLSVTMVTEELSTVVEASRVVKEVVCTLNNSVTSLKEILSIRNEGPDTAARDEDAMTATPSKRTYMDREELSADPVEDSLLSEQQKAWILRDIEGFYKQAIAVEADVVHRKAGSAEQRKRCSERCDIYRQEIAEMDLKIESMRGHHVEEQAGVVATSMLLNRALEEVEAQTRQNEEVLRKLDETEVETKQMIEELEAREKNLRMTVDRSAGRAPSYSFLSKGKEHSSSSAGGLPQPPNLRAYTTLSAYSSSMEEPYRPIDSGRGMGNASFHSDGGMDVHMLAIEYIGESTAKAGLSSSNSSEGSPSEFAASMSSGMGTGNSIAYPTRNWNISESNNRGKAVSLPTKVASAKQKGKKGIDKDKMKTTAISEKIKRRHFVGNL